jgi:hypothetical protein
MRTISFSNREFDLFIWRPVAFQGIGKSDPETFVRLLRLIKGISIEKPVDKGADSDTVIPNRRLPEDGGSLTLEEDEYKLLKDRVEKWVETLVGALADEYFEFRGRLEKAEKFDATPQTASIPIGSET